MDNRILNGAGFLAILGLAMISAAPLGGQEAPSLVTGPGLEVGACLGERCFLAS